MVFNLSKYMPRLNHFCYRFELKVGCYLIGVVVLLESGVFLAGGLGVSTQQRVLDAMVANLCDGVAGSLLVIFGLLVVAGAGDRRVVWLHVGTAGVVSTQALVVAQSVAMVKHLKSVIRLTLTSGILIMVLCFLPVIYSTVEQIHIEQRRLIVLRSTRRWWSQSVPVLRRTSCCCSCSRIPQRKSNSV